MSMKAISADGIRAVILAAMTLTGMTLIAVPRVAGAQAILSGTVTDTAATPIAGAIVTVGGTVVTGRTDERGTFQLFNVPLGVESVSARRLDSLARR